MYAGACQNTAGRVVQSHFPQQSVLILNKTVSFLFVDPSTPNVQVTRLTLVCEAAPAPLTLDLQGE